MENLDVFPGKNRAWLKLKPLPLGILPSAAAKFENKLLHIINFDLPHRIHKCFCCHRIRSGKGQWSERAKVTNRCLKDWVGLTDSFQELENDQFMDALSCYNFTICVHGGGIDPSPRAWEAIIRGSIPIIRESPVAEAYRVLPVVIIPTFDDPKAISLEKMDYWLAKFRGWYEIPGLRRKVMERLSMDYWWWKVNGKG